MRHNKIDTDQVSDHLNRVFQRATKGMDKATRGNTLHGLQVEFCYFLNDIQRSPAYIIPKVITDCNTFIREVVIPTADEFINKKNANK